MPRHTRPTRPPRTTRTRAPKWALVTRPHEQLGPCYALERTRYQDRGRGTVIYVGSAQGPAAHIHARIARAALEQLNALAGGPPPTARATAGSRGQAARSSTPLHTPAHKGSRRHR